MKNVTASVMQENVVPVILLETGLGLLVRATVKDSFAGNQKWDGDCNVWLPLFGPAGSVDAPMPGERLIPVRGPHPCVRSSVSTSQLSRPLPMLGRVTIKS